LETDLLRTSLAATLLSVGMTAQAQNVTIYGIMDLAVEHLTNVNANGDSLKRMPNLTGTLPSRIGFRGSEDLGGGWRALFNLEHGIAADSGGLNNGGRMWGRAAYVGVAGSFGRFTLGRQTTMTVLAVSSHVMGPALYSFASHDPYIPNAISDNSIAWLGTFGGVTTGATYSLGRDTAAVGGPAATNCPGEATDGRQCRQWSALLKYDAPSFGAALSHDVMRGGPGAAFGLTRVQDTDARTVVSGWGRIGSVKLSGGLLRRERDNVAPLKSNLLYAGASIPVNAALTADVEVSRLDVKAGPNDSTMAVLRGVYSLSKRSAVYAMAGQMRNKGSAAVSLSAGGTVGAGMRQSGLAAGIRHTF
jgi:predicted porin